MTANQNTVKALLPQPLMFLILLGGTIAVDLYVVHSVIGLPLIPATVTNDYWQLVTIHLEIFFWSMLFFIPSYMAMLVFMAVVDLTTYVTSFAYYKVIK